MRTTLVIVALLAALLVVAGCTPKSLVPATTTDSVVSDISGDVSGLDAVEADLDTSELNSLDQELADIETLELQ